MRKIIVLFICLGLLSGCTVHRFQKSKGLGGYGVARFGYVIPEYTVDLDNKAPEDLPLAMDRFKRRKGTVESTYIKMGQIEDYITRYITHFPKIMWSLFANTIKMPFHIVSEYRYAHSEKYRQKIDDLDLQAKAKEEERVSALKSQLREFIQQDLEKEKSSLNAPPQ